MDPAVRTIPLLAAPLLGALALGASIPGAGGEPVGSDVPLEYLRYPDEEDVDGPYTYRGELALESLARPPAGVKALPELNSAHPVYVVAQLGDRTHVAILDFQREGSAFYDRLYFDANANGDLTDDPVADPTERARLPGTFLSPPVDMTVVVDGEERPYCLRVKAVGLDLLDAFEMGDEVDVDLLEITLESNCCYTGTIPIGGEDHRILLGDGNVNGRFGDVVTFDRPAEPDPHLALPRAGDQLFLSTAERFHERDAGFLGQRLAVGGKLFAISVDALAARLSLEPLAADLATVKLPLTTERLSLVTEDGAGYLTLYRPGASAQVPAGRYRVADYQLYQDDPQGDRWFLAATVTPRSDVFALQAGSTATLEYGPPFVPAATIPERVYEAFSRGPQDRVEVEFSIGGAGGEVVNDLKRIAGRKTQIALDATGNFPAEPRYFIAQGKGKIVTQGEFEYG